MLNSVAITGRLQATPKLKRGKHHPVAHFFLEVGKEVPLEGEPVADLISCEARDQFAIQLSETPPEHELLVEGKLVSRGIRTVPEAGAVTLVLVTKLRDLGPDSDS